MSSKGNRIIAVVNGPEKYETLPASLRVGIDDINTVTKQGKIDVDGRDIRWKCSLEVITNFY